MKSIHIAMLVAIIALALPAYGLAQESNADYDPDTDDGRLNYNYWMDGFGLYCADANKVVAPTYAEGGGFLLLLEGVEKLWIPEVDIVAGIAEAEETGEFVALGTAPDGTWHYPNPAIYYLPETDEFQINIAKSSPDDLREGKLYEFRWAVCRS